MTNKINSIIQFVGDYIIITNPEQPVTSSRNRGADYPCECVEVFN